MKTQEMIFSGFGGQGIQVIGKLMVTAALEEGLNVSWLPSYGPEMRGGTSNCSVIVTEGEIGSPIVTEASTIIVMNRPSLDKSESYLKPDGLLIMASDLIDINPKRKDIRVIKIPAIMIAEEIGSRQYANMVLLGALIKITKITTMETIMDATKKFGKSKFLDMNLKALELGAAYI